MLFSRRMSIVKNTGRENIVIISLHKIGDTVFTVPAVRWFYKKYKNNLFVVCYPESAKIYDLVLKGIKTKIVTKEDFISNRWATSGAKKIIKDLNPKIIFDLTGTMTSLTLFSNIKVEEIIGITEPAFKNAFTFPVKKNNSGRLTDIYLNVIKTYFNISNIDISNHVRVKFPDNNKNIKIILHPFAGWEAKEWNLNKFISLAELIRKDYKCDIISEPGLISEDIKKHLTSKKIKSIETKNLDDLIAEIKQYDLFIGNDSGPLYLAAMLSKPTFTIYGPTNPNFSLPAEGYHDYINIKLNCSPGDNEQYCFTNAGRNGCPAYECMNLLSVDKVYERVKLFIAGLGKKLQ